MKRYGKVVWVVCIVALIVGGFVYGLYSFGAINPGWIGSPDTVVPVVSTRGHFRNGVLTHKHNAYDFATAGPIPGFTPGMAAPDDLLIIIHGFNNTPEKAANVFALAEDSISRNDFTGGLIGFSWDANTQADPWSMTGFHECRRDACGNGPKLARFIAEYKAMCPQTRIHIMGYSIGARLALETVLALDEDPAFADSSVIIDTVHLVGAAVDNEEVQTNERYGIAIEHRVGILYNYFSLEDDILGTLYPIKETDLALGVTDIENPNFTPFNYVSLDAASEVCTVDVFGRRMDDELGDNHCGCLGIWNSEGELIDDGVMNLVVHSIEEYCQ